MFSALSVRNFRLYFIGQLISISGTWMQSVALGWLVLQLSGSSIDLGLNIAVQFVPMLFFGAYGGLIVDRFEKRRILFVTQSSAGLLALVLGVLVSLHHATLTDLFILAALLGTVNLVDMPARQSFVQEMVGRERIANAVSLNSVLMNAGRLIGPGIATGLLTFMGTAACFYFNALSFGAVLLALALMNPAEFLPMRTVEREKGQVRLGLAYVRRTPLLRDVIIAVAVVGTFAYNFTVTLPLLARTTFHAHSAATYGLFTAAMGAGAIVGGLFVAYRQRPTRRMLATVLLGFALTLTCTTFAPSAFVAALLLVPAGACSIMVISTANALLQTNSTQEMRGRVMSLYGIAFLGTTPIGSPLVGAIVSQTNPRVGIAIGAVSALVAALTLIRAHPAPVPLGTPVAAEQG